MIDSVETNILLDILIPNAAHVQSSLRCLSSIGSKDKLIISEAVYAELGSQFLSFTDLNKFLRNTGIVFAGSNENSLFEASRAWKRYSKRKKDAIVCPSCGKKQTLLLCGTC